MSVYKQALANSKLIIVSLIVALFLSALTNIILGYFLYNVPKEIRVWQQPPIPESGSYLKTKLPSNESVYSFAYYIWESLQSWPVDGKLDYKNNLDKFAPYLTSEFENVLNREALNSDNQGFLTGHQQLITGAGSGYKPSDVKYLGHGTWLVHLTMRTINRVKPVDSSNAFSQSHVDRDAATSYVFKVILADDDLSKNKWRLKLAGYATQPQVIHIYK